ncbi:protein jagged-1-like [Mercenaria mercenaria]|uniref:protein jagged-1-like n=1 Tax=Mercenaria mercenaria TaxID=6596 RepID=UPI00234F5092|nr:protein jagged-1-like [Mercenaria mercenaria]
MISGTGNEVYATCGYFPQTREFPIWKNVQQCKRIECGIPAVPEKAMLTCTNNEKTYQTVCNIDCYHGYSASGPTNIICQANGYWSKAAVCIGHIPEIRECSPSLCNGHTCLLNDNGTFSCDCSFGWTGPYCEDSPDMCVENICMNGAECNSLNKSYTCICQSGYSGSLCQVSPADGNWSDWSIWSKCSVSCGSGVRLRQRSCDNPPPDEHGKVCQGSNTENSDCENDRCEECPTLNINESLTFHECTTDTDTGLKTCEISCKNGTIQLDGFRTLRCGHGTNYYWAPANVPVLCLVPKIPEVYELESEIMYSSSIPIEQQPEVEDHVRKNINDTSCIQSGYCNTTMTFIPNQVSDYTETKLILTFLRYLDYIVNSSGIMDQFVLDELQKAISDLESTAEYLMNYTENVFNVNTNDGLIQADESSLHQQCFTICTEGHISVNGVCGGF